ncbi:protein purity of essence [Condylostylus longicornis]|uniref:protein purity of essence n=1 Tax=Condylostylus longicornis TaxID=2530218 RepID=UPI00244E21A9|nr:protein purity of essence [Condylostylus longicornis]
MAAHSGGVDWAAIIKPFILSNNYGNLNKTDIINIIKAILKGENEFLDHDSTFGQFFMAFSALAADAISGQCNLVCQQQVPQMIEASTILIKYILNRISKSSVNDILLLLPPLKGLCDGKQQTTSFDNAIVSSLLKSSKFPEHSKNNVTSGDKDSPKSEMKRSRSDLSTVILQQLTTPLGANTVNCWAPLSEELTDCTQMFTVANIACLESLNAGDIILEVCSSLPILSKYKLKYEDCALHGKPLYLPLTASEATQLKNLFPQMSTDIKILSQALSLPILEPLTPKKILQLSQCAMSALYCGVLVSISGSVLSMSTGYSSQKNQQSSASAIQPQKDNDELDDHARVIVDKALEIFTTIGDLFRNSARSHIYQNHLCFGAWLLVTGIQGAMGASGSSSSKQSHDEKGKSPARVSGFGSLEQQIPSARVNLFKVQQGFGVLNAAIANHSLILLTELIEDLKIESRSGEENNPNQSNINASEPAGFEILEQYTSLQRVVRVLNSTTLQQLLTFLATVSYRKACNLKRSNLKDRTECDPISYSDSTTYFNDTLSCSDDSETEEEDSESYLGLWFKETLSPEANDEPAETTGQDKTSEPPKSNMVPVKDEPHEYLDLSSQIFSFLDQSLGTNHKFLNKYVESGLSEQQMVLLANILKDLDRDAARGEPDNTACMQWQTAMIKFSGALGRYLHNLISGSLLNETLQSSLLLHLGVSPWTQDTNIWPLQVYSRTLSVLVQILLLKPTQEKEAACLSVWHRLVNTLVEGVCSSGNLNQNSEDYEDLNVEHAQLLLFLFHSLNLMQKKSILLLTAGGVIRCAEVCRSFSPEKPLRDNQLMLLSRLLLFLEYLMKHLYNAPIVLLEQVRWNLFSVITLDANQKVSDLINNKTKMLSFCRKDIEDRYRKFSTEYANAIRPKFYSLAIIDSKTQQEFKLDGLAWNFILCTPDKLKYPLLVNALIDILSVTDICMAKVPVHSLCAVHYCFSLCWKLLLGLPPSTPHVEALMNEKVPNLHSLIWSIRCLNPQPSSHYLIVNSLVKQGMYTQSAETLWSKVIEHVGDTRYSLKNSILGIENFSKTFNTQNPRISKIVLLDAIISHMHAIFWAEREGVKPSKLNPSSSVNSSSHSNSPSPSSSTTSVGALVEQNAAVTGSDSENVEQEGISKDDLSRDLLSKLLDSMEILRDITFKIMTQNLTGPINSEILNNLISIAGSKSSYSTEISNQFINLLSGTDKDIINGEWKKQLNISGEENFTSGHYPAEGHTLGVIDGHLQEISKNANYSILLSLKHALKSTVHLIFYLLPSCKNNQDIMNHLKEILIPFLFDIRTEYIFEISNKCVEAMLSGENSIDDYQFFAYSNILKYSYKVLIDYSEESRQGKNVNLDETILTTILKSYEKMLEKPMGMKAMQDFFYVKKSGSLIELLLSFTNTQLSQGYSTKILQFYEKLFQYAEKSDSKFSMDELSQCISEMGQIDISKLKVWLSHILLGPGNLNQIQQASSGTSSNAQTPTNMATVSAIPSISDQIAAHSSEMEPEDMEVDYDWTVNSFLTNRSETSPNDECVEENGRLLQNITKYLVVESKICSTVSTALFQALIHLGQNLVSSSQDVLDFTDLLLVMVTLADASQGKGHGLLFPAAVSWLEVSKCHVLEKQLNKSQPTTTKAHISLENVISLLRYMSDLLQGLGYKGSRSLTPPWEEEMQADFEDILDDLGGDEEDSAVEDSDEDSLGNKLCTFSQTQKEFMNQHWYHCYTCNMVNSVGVCSVCARVCHKNHDVSYAKYGNFFCDCGAKEDGSCQALTRRVNTSNTQEITNAGASSSNKMFDSFNDHSNISRKRIIAPPSQILTPSINGTTRIENSNDRTTNFYMTKMIETSKDQLNDHEQWTVVIKCILEFFESLMPAIRENCSLYSTVGCQSRAQQALDRLHQPDKSFQISDQIMVPTLGSQEGAFENVRMSYSGEQGQTIKQLLSSGLVRRVALCCLSSPHGKRQHLAVSHEKGKVTILQLSALLKQADAAKRKLTLTQLSSAPIPCTVLSLTANPANEDCLAVCGLKECHILTFSNTGAANEHIVLTPQLETGNFIKKAIWLPGSQTKLALVTADFVKIYELAEDTYSPQYYFLVAVGKIRDCTFIYQEGVYYMVLIASSGYIYYQPLDEESLAKHGDFYVTNTLELNHPHIKDISGQVGGGGVSIYYSHTLQILFFSYSLGRSFMAPLTDINKGVKSIMLLHTGPPNTKNSSKGPPQPLCQWTEILGHPGLICAMMQTSNNPVIFMLKPDGIVMQEIKAQSSKSKIMDMVAIRHTVSGTEKTTLILLCEDGSLRIFTAHNENTNYWLSPEVQPIGNQMYSTNLFAKSSRKNKTKSSSGKSHQSSQKNGGTASNPVFPIDFFEHCSVMSDVEFGGNDLLQIYSTQKLKTRLFSTGMYVVSSKASGGFTLEINNPDPNIVIVGIRVQLGTQDPVRAPTTVTILNRVIQTPVSRPRWFDIPLTREESLQSDKKLSVVFGKSQDPENICMLDSIEIYGKTKDVFGWPEETEEPAVANNGAASSNAVGNSGNIQNGACGSVNGSNDSGAQTITLLDRMVTAMLEVLDSGLGLLGGTNVESNLKQKSMHVATELLLMATPNPVQVQTKCVLATLHGNRNAYHTYKDKEVLKEVDSELQRLDKIENVKSIDPEGFYRLILMTRGIAVARPQTLTKICIENNFKILSYLLKLTKKMYNITPRLDEPCSIVKCGLSHTDAIIHCLVEIIYAFALSEPSQVESMTKYFVELLLDPSKMISHSAKDALILLMSPRLKRRKVVIVSPPACSTPTPLTTPGATVAGNTIPGISGASSSAISAPASIPVQIPVDEPIQGQADQFVEVDDAIGLDVGGNPASLASIEALLGAGYPQLLDLQQDADDEAIMDIAIALSLQQHDGDLSQLPQSLGNLQNVRVGASSSSGVAEASVSNTAAGETIATSAGGSDDEGSNAATDGSTLRTSPAEHASGSGGSESGGSGVESIGGTSGRSSTYGDQPINQSPPRTDIVTQNTNETTTQKNTPITEEQDEHSDSENIAKLHSLRCAILNKIVENFKSLDECNGQQAIPLLQVILMLTTDLDGNRESDQLILNKLLLSLVEKLEIVPAAQATQMVNRTPKTEVQLAMLCLFGVLMGKTKSSSKQAGTTSPPHQFKDNASFVANSTANILMKSGAIPYCLVIMESFLPHWKNLSTNGDNTLSNLSIAPVSSANSTTNNLLKPTNYGPKPDISSLIPINYIKNYPDVFDAYSALLTEFAVRLPYQILKLSSGHPSAYDWYHKFCESMTFTLCEYMMLNLSALLRRQVRKLLMYICGNKEKFRLFRDGHSLDVHINAIKKCCDLSSAKMIGSSNHPILSYDALVELTEHLRACLEVAQVRTGNWQKFCVVHEDVISSLIQICCYQLDDGVSPIILQLLQSALCNTGGNKSDSKSSSGLKSRQDRDKSEENECTSDSKFDSSHCSTFVHQIFRFVPDQLFSKFINIFLLETNITSIRWQAHSLIYAVYENSNDKQKERLLKFLWDMWPYLPAYGRRTAQFVDILGYLTLSTKALSDKLPEYTEKAVAVLRQQNELLSKHPNGPIYTGLTQVLELDGFYLESEPCLVCNNPELPMSNIKLPTIKSDSKFTTTTMIVKLIQSHTISKIILRVADLKRTKMVRTINIYYNNRTVQGVVELKNRPSIWHKARTVSLQSGQTEVKIDFPLPITACNLMVEYADFYETVTGSSENLQCPRCSAAVPAHPGVCANCGENVFQCHKCRAINYDEKDPFLCHSCGFCKYAKFDFSIYGRACCAVDPIESAEDRAKTVQTIHSSLEKADRIYRQLQANKQILEILIQKVNEHKDRGIDESFGTVVSSSLVNKAIQLLAQKYCVESKTSFEELSKVAQKVKACRRELVAYDRSQVDLQVGPSDQMQSEPAVINRCYGCALASTEQCLTLLRAMASNLPCRKGLCEQGLVEELAQNNLRRGTPQIQDEVRSLLCLLTRDLPQPCNSLLTLIHNRVKMVLQGTVPLANLDMAVRHEMALLESMMAQDDTCWEMKLKVVLELFLMAYKDPRGPAISVIQPCLRIIQLLICPPLPTSKNHKEMVTQDLTTLLNIDGFSVDFNKWLDGNEKHSFAAWKQRMPLNVKPNSSGAKPKKQEEKPIQPLPQQVTNNTVTPKSGQRMFGAILEHKRMQYRRAYLSEKYGRKWRNIFLQKGVPNPPLKLTDSWLQPVLFNTNSRFGRQLACSMISSLSRTHERKREILNLLTDFLKYVGEAGEASAEFLTLYRSLAVESPWRQYLALKGVLTLIADLLSSEIEKIHRLEETTLSSDLAQGYALRQFVELLSMFLENSAIRQAYKSKLLGPVLQGYLSLRKLVVQRTRLIDDAQEKLLEMLEEMTTGTEEETRAFMAILIDTVQKTPLNDIKTPVFIFERLYSIIHPEENDDGEFFLTLEKDPQQEDFLQGRMLGNPYPSTEAGLGPLMRDVKNKICTDCELIALLEDDNGMELLVNNKIISLDLQVKEVYKRIWLAEGGERDAMRVVYRMRGLLGDATEEFVETLNNKSQEEVDNETLYCMANVLADCDGLKVMLDRISNIQSISRTRELVQVLLKLFLISVKVRRCQEVLCQPELGAVNTLLKVLQICLQSENDPQQSSITEQLLEIMETILSKAASDTLDSFLQFSLTFGGPEYVTALISCTNCSNVRNNPSVLRHLIRVLAALVYGNEVKMALLCEHFKATLDFDKFDAERSQEDEFKMELFCVLTNQIEHNSIGGTLKDYIIGLEIVGKAIEYITNNAPCVKPTLLRTDSDELKEFISRPSLKYILRFLTGLATKHEATQLAVSKDIIPIIHRLEQVSSDEHVGSLAENLLEALCTDPATAKRVQEVRDFTRAEKKRLAMATREKQLDALGMRTNEKGLITAKGPILQKIEKLRDETGLTCFICREGYACQPSKVLGIYTFTKKTNLEDFELKPRKTLGYTTVTHFNVVHVDCHTSAIRLSRGRDEWERASLQNANTRCNGLLPLWGPDVTESAFSTCMTRHSSYMQESTQRCDISFANSIHDLKLLLSRFAWEKSFHEDAGGGGPQSNMHLVPYLLFYSLYMLLSARTSSREEKNLTTYLALPVGEKWLECAYDVDGPLYQITLSLALHSPTIWRNNKVTHLKRLLAVAQAREISANVLCKALLSNADRTVKDYSVYRPYLMFWGMIDLIYANLFKTVTTPKEEDWPISLFDYIRRNDEANLKNSDTILQTFTDEYIPCASFAEFCDVAGLLNDIENPDQFLLDILLTLPSSSSA